MTTIATKKRKHWISLQISLILCLKKKQSDVLAFLSGKGVFGSLPTDTINH